MKKIELFATGCNLEGIAKDDGKIIFVPYAINGEVIDIKSSINNSKFETVTDFNLIEKSQYRCKPKCKYYGKCGGCQSQHIEYDYEKILKQEMVKNNLKKFKIDTKVSETVPSDSDYNYRNKITLSVDGENLCLKDINNKNIPIDRCEIVDENINKLFPIIKSYLINLKILSSFIKSVIIRYINDKYLILFVITKKINFDFLIKNLIKNKIDFGLFYSINSKNNSNIPTTDFYNEYGIDSIPVIENNIAYSVNPYSFLQVNNAVKTKLYAKVLNCLDTDEVVADCYSGSGLLSAQICKKAKQVYAIEIDKLASEISNKIAKMNNLKNLKSINGDCKNEVPKLCKNIKIDTVILDPPRKGCEKTVLETIIKQPNLKKIIYISCNSATLGRDLQIILQNSNFNIASVTPFDMFSKTANIETLVVLKK